jgi:8-oxo-dGTP pyrophosphatase MutT (NUDIX family)
MNIAQRIGVVVYWILHPAIALYMNKDPRTRVIIRCGHEVLLVRSWLSPSDWYLPGGGLHKHEDPTDGAIRELEEEIGITFQRQVVMHLFETRFRQGFVNYRAHVLLVELDTKPKLSLQKHEISQARWVPLNDAQTPFVHQSTKDIIQRALMV